MIDIKLLEQLCLCNGISGDEGNVRNLIINEIKDCADDIKTDNLGNLIVFKKGKKSAKSKLMVSAHMDEVGLTVTLNLTRSAELTEEFFPVSVYVLAETVLTV